MFKKPFVVWTLVFSSLLGYLIVSPQVAAQNICPLDTLKPKKVESLKTFQKIPVLNQGRIKPLDSFARSLLLQLSGRGHYQKESATEWLARFFFAPRTTYDDKIFLINNPDILEAIDVEKDKHRRYSYRQLETGYDKLKELSQVINTIDEKNQSIVEKEIVRVFNNLRVYIRLSGAFAFAVPHPDFKIELKETKKTLGLPEMESNFSFYDILEISANLEKAGKDLGMKNEQEWSATDKNLATILNALNFWTDHYSQCPLGLIPTFSQNDEEWLSPMDTILSGNTSIESQREIKSLRDMTMYYWKGSQLEFDMSARAFFESIQNRLSLKEKERLQTIPLEIFYNKSNLFRWAKSFYFIGFMLFLFSLIFPQQKLHSLAIFVTMGGFIPHLIALILRMIIMARPPVSNLFETFIFVGLIAVLLGFVLEWVNRDWLGLIVSNISGFILLTIAGKFAVEGDTMQMLVAVLDSNFWLSTHVITITIGYAGCCVAGVMGHIYILQAMNRLTDPKRLEVTYKNMLGILGFGLTMTFLGTTLGGIWADQSWGRFWGWDPKENGALMIVLWSAIIFHAKIAKMINPLGVAVGCILTLINVVWAWFGVNLLSVGLHSYGFTSGIANTLAIYLFIEIIFISITVLTLGRRDIKF